MQKRKQETGEPMTIWIEIGPITHHGTKAEIRRSQFRLKNDLDQLVRDYLRVGKRNETVCTIMEPKRDKDGKVMIGVLSKDSGLT